MKEIPLSFAVRRSLTQINQRGTVFRPNVATLIMDLQASAGLSGVAAFLPEDERSLKGYDLVRWSAANTPTPPITLDDLWACAKEHYGLTATAAALGIAGIPISKLRLGHHWAPGSSKYTNLVSHLGVKFFPMAKLPPGSTAARLAKSTFGTIRVFGIIGRTVPFVAVGLAVFDIISIGICAYEERNRK